MSTIVQLCPLGRSLVAVFKGKEEGQEDRYDVHCWGLSSLGTGSPMICIEGELKPANSRLGFLRLENYKPKP